MRLLALVLALAVAEPKFSDPDAEAAFQEAQAAFEAKDYDAVVEALARVYAIDPQPRILYAQAQAERFAGRCAKASPLYIAFLETRPEPETAELAQWNLSWCLASMSLDANACEQAQGQLAALRSGTEGNRARSQELLELEVRLEACREPGASPVPAFEPEPEPEPEPKPQPPPPVVVKPAPPVTDDRVRVDRWGVGLGVASVLAAGGAVGLFLGARAQLDAVSLEGMHARASTRRDRGRAMQGGAIAAASIAGGLAIGAIVHWAVWRKRGAVKNARTARR